MANPQRKLNARRTGQFNLIKLTLAHSDKDRRTGAPIVARQTGLGHPPMIFLRATWRLRTTDSYGKMPITSSLGANIWRTWPGMDRDLSGPMPRKPPPASVIPKEHREDASRTIMPMKPFGADRSCDADVEMLSASVRCGVAVFAYRFGRSLDVRNV